MRNLIINRVQYTVETQAKKVYGADVTFTTGLNIIYGPNSVGKSSLITGIIYCLGAEKGLGIFQNKQNPFKPEFYDKINGELVTKSYVKLEISNGSKIVTLIRSVIKKTDVVGMKETTIDNFSSTSKIKYLIASGEGVFAENGLQHFLFKFLKWEVVNVPTYDSGISKLYFENLISLFFVEQRAGWSQIQARQVMRYGIREVKKVAFEYIMGLDRFDIHIKEIERKDLLEKLLKLKRELIEKEENLIVLVNGKIEEDVLLVDRPGVGRRSIYDMLNYLRAYYETEQKELNQLTSSTQKTSNNEESLRDNLRGISHQVRKGIDKINSLLQEIAGYENYLERIDINKLKNKQLKKIEGLASELNISTCPICENLITVSEDGVCKLCHSETKRRVSTPDENLDFLEDERASFEKVLATKRLELKKSKAKLEELKQKEKTITENLDHQIATYVGPQLDILRKKIAQIDLLFKDIELMKRVIERWKNLKPLRRAIKRVSKEEEDLKELIAKYNQSKSDRATLATVLQSFQEAVKSLDLLKGKDELISAIRIDEKDYYLPYLEEYDLYNISSSSDNVRIILSYYLALVQTSIKLHQNTKIRFPNLLILDEPKQQNLDDKSLNTFIEILEKLPKNSCQIILTTFSEQKRNKTQLKNFIRHEMKNDLDFLLKEIPS